MSSILNIKKLCWGKKMKKIVSIIIVGILVLGIFSVSAIGMQKTDNIKSLHFQNSTRLIPQNSKKLLTNTVNKISTGGNFSGKFAKKNETGYVILGSLNGTYNKSSNYTGTFKGNWNTTSGNDSGAFSGWFWGYLFIGQIQQKNNSHWFVGLYRVNATANEFGAVSIIFNSSWTVRYAAGTYT